MIVRCVTATMYTTGKSGTERQCINNMWSGDSNWLWEGVVYFCTELAAGNDMVESLWVRIKGQANKVDIAVGVYDRPPCQDDNTNDLLFKELRYL